MTIARRYHGSTVPGVQYYSTRYVAKVTVHYMVERESEREREEKKKSRKQSDDTPL